MGYTHYYKTEKRLNKEQFSKGVEYEEEKFEQDSEKKLEGITGKDGTMTVLCGNPIEWIKSTDVKGTWFAGAKLSTRTCGGNCSHESFVLNVKMRRSNPI